MNHKKLRRLYREERLQVRRRGGRKRAIGNAGRRWRSRRAPISAGAWTSCRMPSPMAAASAFWRRRRLHARMPGAGRRHLAAAALRVVRELDTHHCRARPSGDVRLRQRHRADQHGDPALVAGDSGSNGTTSRPASRSRMPSSRVFNGRLRDELLNETLFTSLGHARAVLADWKDDYNTVRPHSALGNLPPADYAKRSAPGMQRDGALRYCGGSAPRPVASPSHQGSNEARDSTHRWMKRRGSGHGSKEGFKRQPAPVEL